MASYRKVKTGWRVEVYVKGQRASATFDSKAQAKEWVAEKEAQLKRAASGVNVTNTVSDLFDRYIKDVSKHKRSYDKERKRLAAFQDSKLAKIKCCDVKPSDIAEWRDDRLKEVSKSTVAREMTIIKHAFVVATDEWNWLQENPAKNVKKPAQPPPRDRLISKEEVEKICICLGYFGKKEVKTISQRVAIAFLFALETGMRAGEICDLTKEDVDGRVAQLRETKNGRAREVPLSKRALELIEVLPKEKTIFDLKSSQIDANFRKARSRSGVEGVVFHDSRHTAITRLASKLNVLELARMVGHTNINQLQAYYNETAENLASRLD